MPVLCFVTYFSGMHVPPNQFSIVLTLLVFCRSHRVEKNRISDPTTPVQRATATGSLTSLCTSAGRCSWTTSPWGVVAAQSLLRLLFHLSPPSPLPRLRLRRQLPLHPFRGAHAVAARRCRQLVTTLGCGRVRAPRRLLSLRAPCRRQAPPLTGVSRPWAPRSVSRTAVTCVGPLGIRRHCLQLGSVVMSGRTYTSDASSALGTL